MVKKTVSKSVLYYKRLIAVVLALILLVLTTTVIVLGVRLHGVNAELKEAQDKLSEYESTELERLAQEEAERQRDAVPPEQAKPAGELSAPEILANQQLVAHALGSVDSVEGLNCLEGFLEHYKAGVRVFEADLRMTSDGQVVLRHDWRAEMQEGVDEAHIPTLEEFLAKPVLGRYTPLSFRGLLLLMAQYPDVCVITDTKLTDAETVTMQFRAMVDDARALGLSYLFDRMVIQVYSPAHHSVVDAVHHFPYYIYTLYQESFGGDEDAFRSKAVYCQENGILGITISDDRWDSDYLPIASWRELKVFVHTVNDESRVRRLLQDGVSGVYTDFLDPGDLEE